MQLLILHPTHVVDARKRGRASGHKNVAPKLKRGHYTARSTVLAAPPAMVKDKSGEGGQTEVGLDPIREGHGKN